MKHLIQSSATAKPEPSGSTMLSTTPNMLIKLSFLLLLFSISQPKYAQSFVGINGVVETEKISIESSTINFYNYFKLNKNGNTNASAFKGKLNEAQKVQEKTQVVEPRIKSNSP